LGNRPSRRARSIAANRSVGGRVARCMAATPRAPARRRARPILREGVRHLRSHPRSSPDYFPGVALALVGRPRPLWPQVIRGGALMQAPAPRKTRIGGGATSSPRPR
jgi:hypothetical protein